MNIPAAVFKTECLKLMDEVARTGRSIVITKHGKPVAQLGPVAAEPKSLFGYMKGTMTIRGDVVAPVDVSWEAESGGAALARADATQRSRLRKSRAKK